MSELQVTDWSEVLVSDVISEIQTGVSVNSENRIRRVSEIGILKTSCISRGQFFPEEHKAVLADEVKRVKTPLKAESILMSRMNTPSLVGEVGYVQHNHPDIYLPDRLWMFSGKEGISDTLFLSHLLSSDGFRQKLSDIASGTSGSMKNIPQRSFLQIPVQLPPLPEQKKIAEILSGIDRAINANQSLLQKLESIKTAIANEFCSGDPDGPNESIDLAELVEHGAPICYGILMPGDNFLGGVPVVKVKNILNGSIVQDDLLLTDPEIDQKYSRSRITKDDLLITIRGTTGRTAIVPGNLDRANITQDTARIRVKSNVSTALIRIYLDSASGQKYIQEHTIGQAVKGINLADLRKMPIPLKVLALDMRVTDLVVSINARIALLTTKINKFRWHRVAVVSDLLSGRKRVTL
jgi:type I restriction enzyme, S subunit